MPRARTAKRETAARALDVAVGAACDAVFEAAEAGGPGGPGGAAAFASWAVVADVASLVCTGWRGIVRSCARREEWEPLLTLYARLRAGLLRGAAYVLDGVPAALPIRAPQQSAALQLALRSPATRELLRHRARGHQASCILAQRGSLCKALRPLLEEASGEESLRLLPADPEGFFETAPPAARLALFLVQAVLEALRDGASAAHPICYRCGRVSFSSGPPSSRTRTLRALPWLTFGQLHSAEQRYYRGCALRGQAGHRQAAVCSSACLRAHCLEVAARVPPPAPLAPPHCADASELAERLMQRNREARRALLAAPRRAGMLPSSHVAELRRLLVRLLNVDTLIVSAAAYDARARERLWRGGAATSPANWRKTLHAELAQVAMHDVLATTTPLSGGAELHLVTSRVDQKFSQVAISRAEARSAQIFKPGFAARVPAAPGPSSAVPGRPGRRG